MLSYDRWLDSWSGVGHVAAGMHRQGFDLQLTQYDERGWRATFYTTGMEHSPTSATGTAWERTPWRATQRAAWETVALAPAGAFAVACPRPSHKEAREADGSGSEACEVERGQARCCPQVAQ